MKKQAKSFFEIITIALSLILIFGGCKKTDDVGGSVSPINLILNEYLDPGGPIVGLQAWGGSFRCENVRINTTVAVNGKSIVVDFGSTYYSNGECIDPQNGDILPANALIKIGHFANGNYALKIKNAGKELNATLTITDSTFAVDNSGNSDIKFYFPPIIHLLPIDAFWGSMSWYNSPDSDKIVKEFLDTLASKGATPYLLSPANYGFFVMGSGGNITSMNALYSDTLFVQKYDADTAFMHSFLTYFHHKYSVGFSIYTGKGYSFY